jgi:hypothetical protein
MGRGKDEFLRRYGGLRIGETQAQLKDRMAEIDEIMTRLKNGFVTGDDLDPLTRRLCDLKGISFDDDDEEEFSD